MGSSPAPWWVSHVDGLFHRGMGFFFVVSTYWCPSWPEGASTWAVCLIELLRISLTPLGIPMLKINSNKKKEEELLRSLSYRKNTCVQAGSNE